MMLIILLLHQFFREASMIPHLFVAPIIEFEKLSFSSNMLVCGTAVAQQEIKDIQPYKEEHHEKTCHIFRRDHVCYNLCGSRNHCAGLTTGGKHEPSE
jgi:hypothetical protein